MEPLQPQPKRRHRLTLVIGVGVLVLALAAGIWAVSGGSVRSISVKGATFTSTDRILAAAAVDVGTVHDDIPFVEAIARVERLPHVKQAFLALSPTGTLTIRVEERRPLARVVSETGQAWVDADGLLMPVVRDAGIAVPTLRGFRTSLGDTLKSDAFQRTRAFLLAFHSREIAPLTLAELAWVPGTGITARTTDGQARLVFGTDAFPERLDAWEAFYAQIVPYKGIDRFRTVDLRYRDQIVTQENQPTTTR